MKTIRSIAGLAGIAFLVAATPALAAQQPAAEHFVMRNDGPAAPQPLMKRFMAHNAEVAALQPSLITPLVAPDPRLVQYAKLSFSNQYTPAGTQTVNYGNARGGGIIAFNRFEFLASGNAEHGNFVAAAMLSHTFATGSHKNGALTDAFCPTLVAGLAFKKQYDMVSSLGGVMPAGKIATQGRTIAWNELIQMHATRHLWFEAENNATFYFAGPHDGKMQNFGTPAVFYVVRRKEWQPTHPFLILDTGMQVATSSFHIYNHNLISEVRILF